MKNGEPHTRFLTIKALTLDESTKIVWYAKKVMPSDQRLSEKTQERSGWDKRGTSREWRWANEDKVVLPSILGCWSLSQPLWGKGGVHLDGSPIRHKVVHTTD